MGVNPYNPTIGSGGSFVVNDDGTYLNFTVAGSIYFRVRKSDLAFQTTRQIEDNAF